MGPCSGHLISGSSNTTLEIHWPKDFGCLAKPGFIAEPETLVQGCAMWKLRWTLRKLVKSTTTQGPTFASHASVQDHQPSAKHSAGYLCSFYSRRSHNLPNPELDSNMYTEGAVGMSGKCLLTKTDWTEDCCLASWTQTGGPMHTQRLWCRPSLGMSCFCL